MKNKTKVDLEDIGIRKRVALEQLAYYSTSTLRRLIKDLRGEK